MANETKGRVVKRVSFVVVSIVILLAIAGILYKLVPFFWNYISADRTYQKIAEADVTVDGTSGSGWWYKDVSVDFDALEKLNPDVVGWIRFDNTDTIDINYPILYSGDNSTYLSKDINGQNKFAGSIFLEGSDRSDLLDYHNIIYGHNMQDGTMFADLLKYETAGIYKKNQYFTIYTQGEAYRYQIFSYHYAGDDSSVYTVGFQPNKAYQKFINALVKDSDYDTGIVPSEQNWTVTLSTCASDGDKEKFVVHAIRIAEHAIS